MNSFTAQTWVSVENVHSHYTIKYTWSNRKPQHSSSLRPRQHVLDCSLNMGAQERLQLAEEASFPA